MGSTLKPNQRIRVDGRFFRLGTEKFFIRGVTYGPFPPNERDECYPGRRQCLADLRLIRQLGANLLRIYTPPPEWFLDLAEEQGLKLLAGAPWLPNTCFLESRSERKRIRRVVRSLAETCRNRACVLGLSVANEVPSDIARWLGHSAVADFIDQLALEVKSADPELLCAFCNFPTTEFIQPAHTDFVAFNLYLHSREAFEKYLARLQMVSAERPLVVTETGVDTIREGLDRQEEILSWQIQAASDQGAAGIVVFSFTDEWHRGGVFVEDWAFGLTRKDRTLKPAFDAVSRAFHRSAPEASTALPKASVVIACYNGERTLELCLASLEKLRYPDFEVILVDDGSEDKTPEIAARHSAIRYVRLERNLGLSAARNRGVAEARGCVVAFTDADCRVDEDWLYFLVIKLIQGGCQGVGGPNFLPPDDSPMAAVVMASPGGPAPVMLTDEEAEHVPGCNMAFYRRTLLETGCFDPVFRKAGDDVDLCWRVREQGGRIGFSAAAFVWHYRRSTIREYLKQQSGYGEAEALLIRKHPENFNGIGGSLWRGRIYSPARREFVFSRPMIYRGMFALAPFQRIYSAPPDLSALIFNSLEYHCLANLPLLILSIQFPWARPLACVSLGLSLGLPALSALQVNLPQDKKRFWSRPLAALLFFIQPLARGGARHRERFRIRRKPAAMTEDLRSMSRKFEAGALRQLAFWKQHGPTRAQFLERLIDVIRRKGWEARTDGGWSAYDLEIQGARWAQVRITTVAEDHGNGNQLYRFRLHGRTTLLFKLAFAFWALLCVLLISVFPEAVSWITGLAAALPCFWGFAYIQERNLCRWIGLLVEETAREFEMERIEAGER